MISPRDYAADTNLHIGELHATLASWSRCTECGQPVSPTGNDSPRVHDWCAEDRNAQETAADWAAWNSQDA